jgi:hypothetical protein
MIAIYFFLLVLSQETIPYKPNDEFELKMDYAFRLRTIDHTKAVDFTEKSSRSTGPLPYLGLELKLLVVNSNEERVQITDNKGKTVLNKKLKAGLLIKMDLGFTDDMKDRVTAYEYKVLIINANKTPTNQILIHIAEDGTFLVNGEVRGKL